MERMRGNIDQMRADTSGQGQIYPKRKQTCRWRPLHFEESLWLICVNGGSRPKWIWVDQQESNPEKL